MGYDVHITRKQEWFSEDGDEITLEEWKGYVASDREMRLDGFAETKTDDGVLRTENEGLSVWVAYSRNGIEGNMAWFDYSRGNIVVKNPDEEVLKKMFTISKALNAKVQGDDGETYDEKGQPIHQDAETQEKNTRTVNSKKWWQFWK